MRQNPARTGAADMTNGSPAKLLVRFAVPLLIGNLFQQMYNMADSIVVGRFVGKTALAAVGGVFPVMFLMLSVFLGIGIAAMIMISQSVGAGDHARVQKIVDTLCSMFVPASVPLALAGILLCKPLLHLLAVPEDTYAQSWLYMVILFTGIIGSLGYNANSGILQGLGDSRTPLLFLVISSLLNIVLDLLFVVVFRWGVAGAAAATVISQIFSWLFGVGYINRKYTQIHISPFRFRFDKQIAREILKIGLPTALEQAVFSIGNMTLQRMINSNGSAFMAAFNGAGKLDTFMYLPIQSFSTAITTYVGQNIGADRPERVRRGSADAMLLCCGVSIAMAAVLVPAGRLCMLMFTTDPAVIAHGMGYIWRVLPLYWLQGVMYVLNSIMRGAGETRVPMISTMCGLWLARIPAAYLLSHCSVPDNLYFCYAIGWTLGILVSLPYYLSGKWKVNSCRINRKS